MNNPSNKKNNIGGTQERQKDLASTDNFLARAFGCGILEGIHERRKDVVC
jgi:hypothetical protein